MRIYISVNSVEATYYRWQHLYFYTLALTDCLVSANRKQGMIFNQISLWDNRGHANVRTFWTPAKQQSQWENQHNIFHFFVFVVNPRGTRTSALSIHSFVHSHLFAVSHIIRYLHIYHNAPYLPPPLNFVFHFSWVLQLSQEKLKTVLMQNFGGQIRCIMGDVQVACYSKVEL